MSLRVRSRLPLVAALSLSLLGACAGTGAGQSFLPTRAPNSSVPSGPPTPATSVGPGQTAVLEGAELLVRTANGTTLAYVPDVVTARPGVEVTLSFENISTLQHGLRFEAPIGVSTAPSVAPEQAETVRFTAPQPGDYPFLCPVHPQQMRGTLRVSQ